MAQDQREQNLPDDRGGNNTKPEQPVKGANVPEDAAGVGDMSKSGEPTEEDADGSTATEVLEGEPQGEADRLLS
jgi:hypothetical protein